MKRNKLLLTLALSAMVASTGPSVLAQADAGANTAPSTTAPSTETPSTEAPSTQAPSTTEQASPYSDADIKAFADAALAVQAIRNLYLVKIMSAEDEDQRVQLRDAAVREMSGAVERKGLTVERFQQILVQAQGDPALVDRINQQLNAR